MADAAGNPAGVVVSHVEAASAVGLTAAQTAAAVRAGIAGFAEHPRYMPIPLEHEDEPGPLIAAAHGLILHEGWERLIDLLIEPLATLIDSAGLTRGEMARAGLYFALPYADPIIASFRLEQTFFPAVRARLALPTVTDLTGTQTGGTGLFSLLARAAETIARGELDLCVLAAADSYLLEERLELYDEQWRIKSARNPAGFIPGEAAGVLLVETDAHAEANGRAPLLRLRAIGRRREPNPIEGAKASTGGGLAGAIEVAHAQSRNGGSSRWVVSDLDGERYKAFEWGIALARAAARLDPELVHWHPADCIGNVGAAAAAVQLGCVAAAFSRGYAPAESALLFGANDGGQRAAMIVGGPA